VSDVAFAYRGEAWADGPGVVYDRLGAALVSTSPVPIAGTRVLDVGAGSGAASKAVVAAGGRPVALDLSLTMLSHRPATRPPAVLGDARRLPFSDAGFDLVVAAFVLSHVPDPVRVLAEARRVVRGRGAVLASLFSSRSSHPCKSQVDEVAARWGWHPPPWYRRLKTELEPKVAHAAALAELAAQAELDDVVVEEQEVDTGVSSADSIVAWRLGMAHLAPFVASLLPPARAAFVCDARAAVGPEPQPLRPLVLTLSSRAPAQRESVSA
jgi:SAM-dependent methyltransferase